MNELKHKEYNKITSPLACPPILISVIEDINTLAQSDTQLQNHESLKNLNKYLKIIDSDGYINDSNNSLFYKASFVAKFSNDLVEVILQLTESQKTTLNNNNFFEEKDLSKLNENNKNGILLINIQRKLKKSLFEHEEELSKNDFLDEAVFKDGSLKLRDLIGSTFRSVPCNAEESVKIIHNIFSLVQEKSIHFNQNENTWYWNDERIDNSNTLLNFNDKDNTTVTASVLIQFLNALKRNNVIKEDKDNTVLLNKESDALREYDTEAYYNNPKNQLPETVDVSYNDDNKCFQFKVALENGRSYTVQFSIDSKKETIKTHFFCPKHQKAEQEINLSEDQKREVSQLKMLAKKIEKKLLTEIPQESNHTKRLFGKQKKKRFFTNLTDNNKLRFNRSKNSFKLVSNETTNESVGQETGPFSPDTPNNSSKNKDSSQSQNIVC